MSTIVDERVVSMRFDKDQFERGIQSANKSLDELKDKLDFDGAKDSMRSFQETANSFSLAQMGSALNAVSNQFSALEVAGYTVISNLTNKLTNWVTGFTKSLTIDPITTGFSEYELKIDSVQTIMSNVQKDFKDEASALNAVSNALDQLNLYADKTIYNFAEMTRNIGYFTVAGVDLDSSVSAIKGMSNLAAMSGVNSTKAANATYQLSQAMSSGSVKLQDWKSLENAGMGGKNFQDLLIQVAKKNGVKYDSYLKKYKSFRNTLTTGWLTSDIMIEALNMYSGDYGQGMVDFLVSSGNAAKMLAKDTKYLERYGLAATDTFDAETLKDYATELVNLSDVDKFADEGIESTFLYLTEKLGYTREQANEIIKLSKDANEAATKVKTFSQLLDTLKEAAQSGWTESWEYIIGDINEAKEIWTGISNAIGGIIEKYAKARNEVLRTWKEKGGRDSMISAVSGFWDIATTIGGKMHDVFREIFPATTADNLLDFCDRLNKAAEAIKNWLNYVDVGTSITNAYTESLDGANEKVGENNDKVAGGLSRLDKLASVFRGIVAGFGIFREGLKAAWQVVEHIIGRLFPATDGILDGATGLGTFFTDLYNNIVANGTFTKIADDINKVIDAIFDFGAGIVQAFQEAFSAADGEETAADKLKTGFSPLIDALSWIKDKLSSIDFVSAISNFLTGALEKISAFITGLSGLDFAFLGTTLLVGAGGLGVYGFIAGIKELFEKVGDLFEAIKDKFGSFGGRGIAKLGMAVLMLAGAVYIIGTAFQELGKLSVGQIVKGSIAIGSIMAGLFVFSFGISKLNIRVNAGSMLALMALAGAIKILSTVITDISRLSWKSIDKGLTTIFGLVAIIAGFLVLTSKMKAFFGINLRKMGSLILFAYSLKTLVGVIGDISQYSYSDIDKGVTTIGALAGVMAVFLIVVKKFNGFTDVGLRKMLGLIAFAYSVKMLTSAVIGMTVFPLGLLMKGVVVVGAISAIIAGFLILTNKFGGFNSAGLFKMGSLILFAYSIKMFVSTFAEIAKYDMDQLERIGISLAGLMGLIALFMTGTQFISGTFMKMTSLVILAMAIKSLIATFAEINKFSVGELIKVEAALAGILGIIAVFSLITKGATGSIKNSISLIGIAFSIKLLVSTFEDISRNSVGQLLNITSMLITMGIYLLTFSAVLATIDLSVFKAGAVVLIALSMSILANAMSKLAGINLGDGIKAVAFMAGGLLVVMAAFKALNGANFGGILKSALSVLVIGLAFQVFAAVFGAIEDVDWKVIAAFTSGIAAALLGMGVLSKGLNGIKMGPLLGASIGVAIVGAAFGFILTNIAGKDLSNSTILSFCGGIAAVLLAFGVACKYAKNVTFSGIGKLMLGIVGVVATILVVGAIAGWLSKEAPGFVSSIADSGTTLAALGSAIGSFYGAAAAEVMDAMFEGLPALGTYLSEFAVNSKDFFNVFVPNVKGLSDETIGKIGSLFSALSEIGITTEEIDATIAGGKGNLAGLRGGYANLQVKNTSYSEYAAGLEQIITTVNGLVEKAKEYEDNEASLAVALDTVKRAAGIVGEDLPLQELTASGGYIGTGIAAAGYLDVKVVEIGEYGRAIASIIDAYGKFITDTSGLTGEQTSTVEGLFTNLEGLIGAFVLPEQSTSLGGGAITGPAVVAGYFDNQKADMEAFSTGFSDILGAYSAFCETASGLSGENATVISGYISDLSDLLNSFTLPTTSTEGALFGIAGPIAVTGYFSSQTATVDAYATGVSSILSSVGDYITNCSGITDEQKKNIDASNTLLTSLTGILAELPSTDTTTVATLVGGWETKHVTNLGVLTSGLTSLGPAINQYVDAVKDTDIQKANETIPLLTTLGSLVAELPTAWTVSWSEVSGLYDFADMAEDLPTLGTAIKDFYGNIAEGKDDIASIVSSGGDLDTTAGSKVINFLDDLIVLFTDLWGTSEILYTWGDDWLSSDAAVFTAIGRLDTVISSLSAVLDDADFMDKLDEFTEIEGLSALGEKLSFSIQDGFSTEASTSNMLAAAKSMMTPTYTYMDQQPARWRSIGVNCAAGLASGLRSSESIMQITAASNYAGDTAAEAVAANLEVHSPSERFADIGMYCMIGLANGIAKYSSEAEVSSAQAAKNVYETTSTIMGEMSAILASDVDAQPVIRPVLDMSDIEAGMTSMNTMFGGRSISVGTSTRIAREVATSDAFANQNGNIVNELRSLGERVNTLGNDMAGLKVYMDTGVLVGEIVPGVDKALGQRSIRERRR